MPLWFTLSCLKESEGNALEMANSFFETNLFSAANPNLMIEHPETCMNDTYFNNQWGLKSTGQYSSSVDIKVCDAWDVTHGSDNVIIALIDHPIKLGHPDLTNISDDTYGANFDNLSNQIKSYCIHGISVAGIMSANANNSIGIAGIADKCPLIATNYVPSGNNSEQEIADGINFAWQNGASVINGSLISEESDIIYDAIVGALTNGRNGLGCVMVFSTGNEDGNVAFPSNATPDIISVGMISTCAQRLVNGQCGVNGEWEGSQYGSELDIMAPGFHIPTTAMASTNYLFEYNQHFGGTSAASPHVAAIAALILSVNHDLTQDQVRDIIESTAQKIGGYNYVATTGRSNGTWHEEMGYGLIDAEAAVNEAVSLCSTGTYDLYSKDNNNDIGLEPNPANTYEFSRNPLMYMSDDIWVRNQNDGFTNRIHQNPEFTINEPIYVYVRIRNKGCEPSSGTNLLKLYWAKAATALSWSYPWDGSGNLVGKPPLGNMIDVQAISSIQSGGDEIIEFEWYPPNPNNYSSWFGSENGHFCLLARIEEDKSQGGMHKVEDANLYDNVRQNNNIVWKNITIFDIMPGAPSPVKKGCVIVRNFGEETDAISLKMTVPSLEFDNSIFDHGIVQLELEPKLLTEWENGGTVGDGITAVDNIITLIGAGSWIGNLTLPTDTQYIACVKFTATDSSASVEDTKYNLDLLQIDAEGEIIGGERYCINFGLTEEPEGEPLKANISNEKQLRINIFPNPAKNSFTVQGDSKQSYNLRIIDILGREKFKDNFIESATIITSSYSHGLYFIVITENNSNSQTVKKLILE
jgi:subtilisin family serine protease